MVGMQEVPKVTYSSLGSVCAMGAGVDCGGWRAPRCRRRRRRRSRRRRRRQCQYGTFRLRWLPSPAPTACFGPAPHPVAVVLAPGLVRAGTTRPHCLVPTTNSARAWF